MFKDVHGVRAASTFFTISLFIGSVAFGQDASVASVPEDAANTSQTSANTETQPEQPTQISDYDRTRTSYVIPALEIVGFNFALNRIDHAFLPDPDTFAVSKKSIRRNLHGPWVVDNDPFAVNQFLHPY